MIWWVVHKIKWNNILAYLVEKEMREKDRYFFFSCIKMKGKNYMKYSRLKMKCVENNFFCPCVKESALLFS